MYVCICNAVTEQEVRAHVVSGARTESEVGMRCAAGTRCGSCLDRICDIIDEVAPDCAAAPA